METVHVRIEGKVQGVFFRDSTKKQADNLGLKGWVQNMEDGAVEAVFYGKDKDIDAIVEWLNTGSPDSKVSKVAVNEYLSIQDFSDFQIIS